MANFLLESVIRISSAMIDISALYGIYSVLKDDKTIDNNLSIDKLKDIINKSSSISSLERLYVKNILHCVFDKYIHTIIKDEELNKLLVNTKKKDSNKLAKERLRNYTHHVIDKLKTDFIKFDDSEVSVFDQILGSILDEHLKDCLKRCIHNSMNKYENNLEDYIYKMFFENIDCSTIKTGADYFTYIIDIFSKVVADPGDTRNYIIDNIVSTLEYKPTTINSNKKRSRNDTNIERPTKKQKK